MLQLSFSGLRLLQSLDVSNNLMQTINNPVPQKQIPLRNLNLALNNITEINQRFFNSFPSLETFNITGNSLQTLPNLPQSLEKVCLRVMF